jgi:mRNA (guanine-N7-)-methyltransferase
LGEVDTSSGISSVREAWESQRKNYDVEFFEADPSKDDFEIQLQKKLEQADLVSCWRHLQV